MKKYFLFLTSFFLLFSLYFFQNVRVAEAFVAPNGPCNQADDFTAQQTWNNPALDCDPNNPQGPCANVFGNMCDPRVDTCQPLGKPNAAGGQAYTCQTNPNLQNHTGTTTLNCTCQNPGKAGDGKNNGYTCTANGQPVSVGGKNVDYCFNGEVCQPGGASDVRQLPKGQASQTIFDPSKYTVTGVKCTTAQHTATCTCDAKGNVTCTNELKQKSSTTCSTNFACKAATDQAVDRTQLQGGTSFMPNTVLTGVACVAEKAVCICGNPNQDGTMTCTLNGKQSKTSCGLSKICNTSTSGTVTLQDLNPAPVGYTQLISITGVQCTDNPISPTLPPPPSPPCMTWVSGECTQFASGIGIFSTEPEGFIQTIFSILLSVSGGVAILLIIRAGYQLMTSQGKPEQVNQGRDQLIAAIVGLLFLIFSFVFLQLITVDLIKIPGFTATTTTATTCKPSQCVKSADCTTLTRGMDVKCTTTGCPAGEACAP